jgi:NADPH-dependent 2,4-dienoyl-CoA reductase/sulfur reductase-like enzyme/nitrite reductase/ring-hydroxylating ferredoxin subunit
MAEQQTSPGPDFALGVAADDLADGAVLTGHVAGKDAIMVRRGADVFVVGAYCSHYHAPLADGLVVGDEIRCPWHHACFSLKTGAATRAPAFDALRAWRVERVGDVYFVRERLAQPTPRPAVHADAPQRIVIVGGGAAGFAAAHALRAEGWEGLLEIVSADTAAPYDRPNLSKDYLAGSAQPEWLPLRAPDWYRDHGVQLRLGRRALALDAGARRLSLDDGAEIAFDRLLIATGADPVRLPTPGADLPHVFYLRSQADADRLIAACAGVKSVAVIGASFIGLETAGALRARGLEVHVVAPEAVPMARILGPELGAHIRTLHESHGVIFHLEDIATQIDPQRLTLRSGAVVAAELVVIGVGVRPNLALAEQAGLAVDKGVLVDEFLATSAAHIYAAGDIASWPDRATGGRLRVEHWVVAERQGRTAARNMLGFQETFDATPFFWSQHYDQTISYVGHAAAWDRTEISGTPESGDCMVAFYEGAVRRAVATLGRDRDCLLAEVDFEKAIGASP